MRLRYPPTSNMRLSATKACRLVSVSTCTTFMPTPAMIPSITHSTYAGWMRYIVAHGQTTGSRQKIRLSGFSSRRRFTMLISVPIAQDVPDGAPSTVFRMNSVDPLQSAASTTSRTHSGWTTTLTSGSSRRESSICLTVKRV